MKSRAIVMIIIGIAGFFCAPNAFSDTAAESEQMGFFALYAQNREQAVANYITEDLLLLSYSMIRRQTLADTETQQLQPLLTRLLEGLDKALAAETQSDEAITSANREFITLLQTLLNGQDSLSDNPSVQEELRLVLDGKGIAVSPFWSQVIDYSQFQPRGRYTATPELAAYFRALRYAGAVLFPIQPSQATGVTPESADKLTAQALQLAKTIAGDAELTDIYSELDDLLTWRFGAAEDLTNQELLAQASVNNINETRENLIRYAREQQRQPRILSGIVDKANLEDGVTAHAVLTGWRLLPARYTPASAALQHLVYDQVGRYLNACGDCPAPFGLTVINGAAVKGFPSLMELMALFGSEQARAQITQSRQDNFEGYPEAYQTAAALLSDTTGLSAAHALLIQTWLQDELAAADSSARRLNSMLAFWTWQRYLAVLYSKQSYTAAGKSLQLPSPRSGAWLEPAVELYLALTYIVASHQRMAPHPLWQDYAQLLDNCLHIAVKIRRQAKLSEQDEAFLNGLDRQLLALTGGPDAPIVVDIHTNPASEEVVEEGIGFAREVFKGDARGALFSHYEFKQPLAQRLTDDAWQTMLRSGAMPGNRLQE